MALIHIVRLADLIRESFCKTGQRKPLPTRDVLPPGAVSLCKVGVQRHPLGSLSGPRPELGLEVQNPHLWNFETVRFHAAAKPLTTSRLKNQ